METFASRLKLVIEKKGLSQTETAKLAGISQQSINYIINNNLVSSKLAPQIASALKINPTWLSAGIGQMNELCVYELPILKNHYQIIKFLNNDLSHDEIQYTVTEVNLGEHAFAYIWKQNQLAICSSIKTLEVANYLKINSTEIVIMEKFEAGAFAIFEWRTRDVTF